MTKEANAGNSYLHVIRVIIVAFLKGLAPMLALEMGRRAIPDYARPTFDEMETACKRSAAAEASVAGSAQETQAASSSAA